jgi:uncharacterized protein YdhG (YjbR/CyaY superfamily)
VKKGKRESRSAKTTKAVPKNFDEYLATVPADAWTMLGKMRGAIQSALPGDVTETISYRIPAFRSDKGVLAWYAAFADHCSLFPTAAVIDEFGDKLENFSTSKGTIHFPLGEVLPVALIKELGKTRVKHQRTEKRQR